MKYVQYFFCSFLLFFTLCGCTEDKRDSNVLVVGTSLDLPPYEFVKASKADGFDIDLIHEVAKLLDKKVIIENMDFNGLVAALNSKKVDVVIACFSKTPEREKQVDFSDVYLKTEFALVYRKDDAFKSVSDLRGKVIGALLGTTWAEAATNIAKDFLATTHLLSNNLLLIEQLKSNAIDALIIESSPAEKIKQLNPNLDYFIMENLTSEFVIAIPKDSDLKIAINNAIAILKKEGVIKKLQDKWFN